MKHLALAVLALGAAAAPAHAREPWIAAGDTRVRHDVQLLVDSGVIELPMSAWPIPAADLSAALARVDTLTPTLSRQGGRGSRSPSPASAGEGRGEGRSLTPAQAAAIARLRKLVGSGDDGHDLGLQVSAAARPTTLRTFEDTPREEGELTGWIAGTVGDRWGGRFELTGAVDPDDDEAVRLDGSYFAGQFGNWIVTAGAQDRWWGSGWEGSLILSNNARPVPALSLDRAVSKPFETKWLSWIGPWRLTTFMGYMDGDRGDYDHPLLFGMRVSARPLDGLEISLERTAQWCGEGRSCDLGDFWNLWSGNDNAGENVDPEDEPGNQLAGWDIRWASPIGDWPYALYFQHTGETIDNQIPRPYRSLELAGAEVWGEDGGGASWRVALEWALHPLRRHRERREALGLRLQQPGVLCRGLPLLGPAARSLHGRRRRDVLAALRARGAGRVDLDGGGALHRGQPGRLRARRTHIPWPPGRSSGPASTWSTGTRWPPVGWRQGSARTSGSATGTTATRCSAGPT